MSKSNVRETTTTTGTGNITLAGVSESGRTFTSQYATNVRFSYYIDDQAGNFEEGIGYLSDSTTLVREKPTDGSAALPVNFGAGTKQVFVGATPCNIINNAIAFSSVGSVSKLVAPTNAIRTNVNKALVADTIYFMPVYYHRAMLVDTLAAPVRVGAGTAANKIHVGIYDQDPVTGDPGQLLFSVTDLDPSAAVLVSATFTEQILQAGTYYLAIWSDVAVQLRANDAAISQSGFFSVVGTAISKVGHMTLAGQAALTDLPATATPTAASTATWPVALIGHS